VTFHACSARHLLASHSVASRTPESLIFSFSSKVQSFRSPAVSGLLFGIAPKSNQKGLAPNAVPHRASARRGALRFSPTPGGSDSTSMYCFASAAIHRRAPSGSSGAGCDARHREQRVDPRNRASLHCVTHVFRLDTRTKRAVAVASAAGSRRNGAPCGAASVRRKMPVGWRAGCAPVRCQHTDVLSANHRSTLAKSEGRMPGDRAAGGVLSLVTFFAQAKKVTRSAAGRVEAVHFRNCRIKMDSRLRGNDGESGASP